MLPNPKEIFRDYCKTKGMRYTPERDVIIDEIYRKDGHFDIDNLFLRIRQRHPKLKIAKASIYRSIPAFLKAGLIRESYAEEGHICYEHILGHEHHDHMKCIGCGKIFEFYNDTIDKTQLSLCKKKKFRMVWHMHVIFGYCSACQKKK